MPCEKNSSTLKTNTSHRFITNSSHANVSHMYPENEPNDNLLLNLHGNSDILLDPTLDYINRCLLKEDLDVDEHANIYQGATLRDMEKSFYDILGEKYPPSLDNQLLTKQSTESPDFTHFISKDQVGPSFSESSKKELSTENFLVTEFHKGVEEGMSFLPNLKRLSIDLPMDQMKKCDRNSLELRLEEENKNGLQVRYKGKKSPNDEDVDMSEGRNRKVPLLSSEEPIRGEMLNKVLLYHGESYATEEISSLRETMKLKEPKLCRKNQNKDYHTSLSALLISCAEAVSTNNKEIAGELIKTIRKQASSSGDGAQRLACVLADGLEARLAGAGSATYCQLPMRQLSAADFLKAFHLSIRASPMMRVSFHFANKSILHVVGTSSKIHVIDFGVSFGFQWPSLIQLLAKRDGGPPKLRITVVDIPQPGFRPDKRVKETGRMLEEYARDFKVPFKYQGIISQWESICMEDLSINDDEVLIINSMYQLSQVKDEPLLGINSPRNNFLKLIFEAKPRIFIQGIDNFSSSPFFITRFKKVLSHYSRFFERLDILVPRDNKPRGLMERTILSPSIINQIACEGSDVVRPETYKQWNVRNLKIGFEQLPLDPTVVKECHRIARNGYDRRFFIEEDGNWLLHGWNGSINYAMSLWKPPVEV